MGTCVSAPEAGVLAAYARMQRCLYLNNLRNVCSSRTVPQTVKSSLLLELVGSCFAAEIRNSFTAAARINSAEKVILTVGLARARETRRSAFEYVSESEREDTGTRRIIGTICDFLALLSHDREGIGFILEKSSSSDTSRAWLFLDLSDAISKLSLENVNTCNSCSLPRSYRCNATGKSTRADQLHE